MLDARIPIQTRRDTHHECSDGENGTPCAISKGEHENREQNDVPDGQPSLEHGSNLTADGLEAGEPPHLSDDVRTNVNICDVGLALGNPR